MKKTKGILMIGLLTLVILLCGTKAVKASSTVNNEEELIAFVQSSTETECSLGKDITLTKALIVEDYNKTIDLNGKHLDAPKAIEVKSVKLTINDSIGTGKYTCLKDYGIFAYDNGTVVVNGGNFESLDGVLTGNNTKGDMNFEVNGGTLTSKQGATIYMPGQVNLKITGGTLNGGINVRMGQIVISGGTINNTNSVNTDKIKDYYDFAGSVWYDSAIVFTTGTYTSDNAQFGNSLNVKISGGTINSTIGNAISVYGLGKVKQDVNISITGGTFSGKDTDVAVYDITKESYVTKTEYKAVNNDNKLSITGGTFKNNNETYLADGYIQEKTDSGYVVKENVVLDFADSKTGDTLVSFESEKPLANNYQLVVENKEIKVEDAVTVNKDAETSISKLYDETKTKINDTKVLLAYDISVSDGSQVVKIEGTDNYKISIKIDEDLTKDYSNFKVAYLDNNGNVKELLDAKLVNGKIEFVTNHLSTYAVVGYNTEAVKEDNTETAGNENTENVSNEQENIADEKDESPKTGDNIISYIGASLVLTFGAIVVLSKKIKLAK